MPIHEALPNNLVFERPVIFSAKADINEDGNFEGRWLAITEENVLVYSSEGEILMEVLLSDIKGARLDQYIGGGCLVIETFQRNAIALVRYTSSLTNKFSIAVKVISNLVNKEPVPVLSTKDLPRICPSCGRPLQEGTSVCPVCVDKKKVIGRLFNYTKPYRNKTILAVILLIIATLVELAPPYITKIIVDDVLEPRDFGGALGTFVFALGATSLLVTIMQTLRGILGVWIGSNIMGDIRKDIYQSLMRLSLSYFDRRQTSQFIGRVNSDAEAIRQFLTDGILWIGAQFIMLIAIICLMFTLSWKLALLAILPTPIVILFSLKIWPKINNLWYKQWQAINRLNIVVGDSLQGIRVVKAFGQEAQERNRYMTGNKRLIAQTIKTDGMWQGIFPLFSFLTGTGILLVWYFGGVSVLKDEITLGTLMAFIAYLGIFFGPLQWFNQMINWLSQAIAAADRVFEIMDTASEVPDSPDAASLKKVRGAVKLEAVSFGYEKYHPNLKNINLLVKPGEMIGLVGHSGAGKSTLINLISRFYDPHEGKITIDGIDLRDIKQEDLHKHIGVVLQETFLFAGTISENIAYSKPDATPEEIMRAAKIANAHDFIVKMADGYDTKVGERGQRLSGGQKQRIAIARAILHDPRILILDEATASVDTETERKIQEAISRLVKGRTTFAIAHRLSTLRNADRLVVIDKGEIAEVGTHDQLLAEKGIYFTLVEAQKELSKIKGVEVG
ncbi:ABC transporter ATP-binding protein [Bacillus sp. T33-2]|uniref:ABC transporter ATP-binding protein n=1 Tax=Bacillus sp. T33-2 TaxID=2054168 RepID=UPI000C76F372|nr:ABC transporter ATP-binding protein [Bacillus sp. T33-2]PLR99069.1 ABC transporter [Bacillus sp. T33-2]